MTTTANSRRPGRHAEGAGTDQSRFVGPKSGTSSGRDASRSRNAGKLGISRRKKLASSMFAWSLVPLVDEEDREPGEDRAPPSATSGVRSRAGPRAARTRAAGPPRRTRGRRRCSCCNWPQFRSMYLLNGVVSDSSGSPAATVAGCPWSPPSEAKAGSWPRPRSFQSASSSSPGTMAVSSVPSCSHRRATRRQSTAAPTNSVFDGLMPIAKERTIPARAASRQSRVSTARTTRKAVSSRKTIDGKSARRRVRTAAGA